MIDLCCQTLLSVSEFCIISLVFGLNMPRGKKSLLVKSVLLVVLLLISVE